MRRLLAVLLLVWPLAAEAKKPPPPPEWSADVAAEDHVKAGTAAITAKKPDDAVAAFTVALEKQPGCGIAQLGLGRALVMAGRPAEALVPLDAAAKAFPDKLDVQIWLGRAQVGAGKPDDGLATAKAVLATKPASVEAQRVAQEALIAKKDFAGAHVLLAEARKVANVVAYNCLEGLVYAEEGDAAKAAEMLPLCQGVPDRALYDALAAKVAPPSP
ncbi:MAG: tetratricopeptide repeat protein [Myxococcota bacterium]